MGLGSWLGFRVRVRVRVRGRVRVRVKVRVRVRVRVRAVPSTQLAVPTKGLVSIPGGVVALEKIPYVSYTTRERPTILRVEMAVSGGCRQHTIEYR